MSSSHELPSELVSDILAYAIQDHPRPNDILSVNSAFHDIGARLLYGRLCFRTIRQLSAFGELTTRVPYTPRHIELTLA